MNLAAYIREDLKCHIRSDGTLPCKLVLEALIAKDWVKARQALSDHIWAQRQILKGLLDTAPRSR